MSEYIYRTVDFRPAPCPGWRALYLNEPTGRRTHLVVGWLIEEELELHRSGDPTPTGDRRAVAAVIVEDGEATVASHLDGFFCVLGPDEPEPTAEEEAEHRKREAEAIARILAAAKAKATQ